MSAAAKHCLVTGGTQGIGKAIVEKFAQEKFKVFTCSRHQDELKAQLKEWKTSGYDIQGCACDVSKLDEIKHLVDKVKEWCDGRLHVLVNNAGSIIRLRAIEYEDGHYDELMNTNLKSAFDLSRLSHPMLKATRNASVIHIGSVGGGSRVHASGCLYNMGKASLKQLAKTLACEWAVDGIRVNCIAPGYIETRASRRVTKDEEFFEKVMYEVPMKRIGQPDEISGVVVFFCSDQASYITGQTLYVDGGYSVRGVGY